MIDVQIAGGLRGGSTKAAEVRRCYSNVDPEATMHAQPDDLLTATYVLVDDFLPKRRGPGRPPRITDAELITLAIAQVFIGLPNHRQFLALAGYPLSHLFAYLPRQSGYNKRLRALTPQLERVPLAGLTVIADKGFAGASSATAPAHSRPVRPRRAAAPRPRRRAPA